MSQRRRILLFLIVLLLLTSVLSLALFGCAKPTPKEDDQKEEEVSPQPIAPKYSKAIYIYMCGSNLESRYGNATENIDEMIGAKLPDDLAVFIETGGAKKWRGHGIRNDKISRYILREDKIELLETTPNASMGALSTFESFLEYGYSNFPAEKTGIILWDHGNGASKGICFDENYYNDSLTVSNIDKAFDKFKIKVDMIGFDACLMAGMETIEMLYEHAHYMLASAELEPACGWDYVSIIENFGKDDGYNKIMEGYKAKCLKAKAFEYTLSLIDLTQFDVLDKAFDSVVTRLNSLDRLRDGVIAADNAMFYGNNGSFDSYTDLIDLCQFADHLGVHEMREALDRVVTSYVGPIFVGTKGISIYYPLHVNKRKIEEYLALPIDAEYKRFIKENYTTNEDDLVHFESQGIGDDGEVFVTVTADSMKYIKDAEYKVYMMGRGEHQDKISLLGYDSDVVNDGNKFTSHFGARWLEWNGTYIITTVLEADEQFTLFATPIKLNGVKGTYRFIYGPIYENSDKIGIFPIGFVADESGLFGRIVDIEMDDRVTILHDIRHVEEYEPQQVDGKSFLFKDGGEITVGLPDEPCSFQGYIIVTDIFGNKYRSDAKTSYFDGTKLSAVAP